MRKFTFLIATFLFIGYFPLMPGTVASLAGVLLFLLFKNNPIVLLLVTAILVVLGFYSAELAENYFKKKDAKQIVIDEVIGMLLCLVLLPADKLNGWILFLVFIVFRIFDWIKPYPIKKSQELKGSLGIILDDILAAGYTLIIFQIFFKIASWITS